MKKEYCALCNLALAPYDPNQVKVNKKFYHQSCLKRKLRQIEPLQIDEIKVKMEVVPLSQLSINFD